MVHIAINWWHKGRQHLNQCDSSIICRHKAAFFLWIRFFQVFLALGLWAFSGHALEFWSFFKLRDIEAFFGLTALSRHSGYSGSVRTRISDDFPGFLGQGVLDNHRWSLGIVVRGTVTGVLQRFKTQKAYFHWWISTNNGLSLFKITLEVNWSS